MSTTLEDWCKCLSDWGVAVVGQEERPWGGFLVLDLEMAVSTPELWPTRLRLERYEACAEARILVVGDLLRIQCHARRREVWRVLQGEGVVFYEPTPLPKQGGRQSAGAGAPVEVGPIRMVRLRAGDTLSIPRWSVHTLLPDRGQGIALAEIWVHDPTHPTDENDVICLFDPWSKRG